MPEISLKAYFGKLNSLLSINAADEVIHHSRHILQSYPKNVTAYRYLGRALVLNGRWDEGRETLRRVLTVYPDDYIAHLGLSEANEHLNRPDEAIWHLERAYEQNPNNKEVIDALRGLYRRYRNVDNLKIQLTAAAVARQNLRSGNYTQAVDTLRSARARMNDRLDLKLLLAQILWDQGSHEEAAEIAVEVLKVLPDCLEANKIMAKLWLSLNRPSDAQRYVNHLENVDPYLAVEVVQGTPPDDDVFRLDELDYVRTAASEMASARPDWLQEISSSAPAAAAVAATSSGSERDDWSNWTSTLLGNQSSEPAEQAPTLEETEEEPMSARFAAMQQSEPVRGESLTDLFGAVDEAPEDELAALFESAPVASVDNDEDPLAWMRDAGIETFDEDEEPSFDSLFTSVANDSGPLPEMDSNPMAWLESSNNDLIIEESEPARLQADDDEPVFGWMQGDNAEASGVLDSWDDPAPAAAFEATNESLDWLQDDHLLDEALRLEGHLSDDPGVPPQSVETFSAFSAEILDGRDDMLDQTLEADESEPVVPGARRGLTAILQEADFDWMQDQQAEAVGGLDDDMEDWLNQFGPAQPRPAVTDTPDWLTDLEEPETATVEDEEEDDWLPAGAVAGIAAVETFATMNNDQSGDDADELYDDDDDADWLAEFAPEEETGSESELPLASDDNEPDWLRGGLSANEPAAADDDDGALPDWLNDHVPSASEPAAPSVPAIPVGEIDWSASSTPVTEDETALSDWLSEIESGDDADGELAGETALEASVEADYTWLNDSAEAAAPVIGEEEVDWLSELAPDTEQPVEPAAPETERKLVDTGELPGWLAELESETAHEQAIVEDDYTWMHSGERNATGTEEAAPAANEEVDWLSDFAPEAEEAAPVAAAVADVVNAEEADWLSELSDAAEDGGELEAEVAGELAPSEEMDWLSELAPAELAPEGEGAIHPSDDDAGISGSEVSAAAAAVGVADWLSELGEDQSSPQTEAVTEPASSEDMGWLSEFEPAELAPDGETAAVAAGHEDYTWQHEESETGEPAEIVAAEVSTAIDEGEDWLSELETGGETGEPVEVAAAEVSTAIDEGEDWLSELETGGETGEPVEVAVAEVSTALDEGEDWLSELETSEPVEAAAALGDDDDWLSELESAVSETEASAEPIVADEEDLSWLAADEVSDSELEEALQPASDEDMEWLSELDPAGVAGAAAAAAVVASAETEEPVNEEDASWLAADEADESVEAEPVAEADAFAEHEPEYAAPEAEAGEEALEPTPAMNAPDWLNAMVPGLDVDYEAAEDEWIEGEEAAFDASEREYAWVEQMVEEEMSEVAYAGYSFSHPPAWLSSGGASSQPSAPEDDLPDWISDDADTDVPSWLR